MSYMDTKFCTVCDEDYNWAAPECPGCAARKFQLQQQKELDALKEDVRLLKDLLAVLCRDGGHYAQEHGTKKAVEYALGHYYGLVRETDALKPKPSNKSPKDDREGYLNDELVDLHNKLLKAGYAEIEFLNYLRSWIDGAIATSQEYNYANAQEYLELKRKLGTA